MRDVERDAGRAGLLPPSKEGPMGGNLPRHVPGEYCVVCMYSHTNTHALM